MNGWLDVMVGVVLGLVVNECTEMSPWLAYKAMRWVEVIRRPEEVEDFAEARLATVYHRPGKLFKLFTALGFLFAALAHRAVKAESKGRPSFLWVLRVRVLAAGLAGVLYAVSWGLWCLFLGKPAFMVMIVIGSTLFVTALVVFHLPRPRSVTALGWAVLPTALVSLLWIGAVPQQTVILATVIAPVYGVAHAVRTSLRGSRLLTKIGLVVAVGALITIAAAIRLDAMSYDVVFSWLLCVIGLGVVGGLHVGVGLLVIEHVKKRGTTSVTPSGAVPAPRPN
ncbi:hypothetical protein [Actinophytocola sp.]|uniref:hypothetical protein n=1 Tax=Actinophytocola sp. TaxID=1872138 RepID=UPI002D29F5C6|nr:hypothetical protein [Actinophytocola sp.]HYQ69424.1 hypothetical protein [Actinophytocola sp.]